MQKLVLYNVVSAVVVLLAFYSLLSIWAKQSTPFASWEALYAIAGNIKCCADKSRDDCFLWLEFFQLLLQ
jgi:hypothetical protein